MDWIDLKQASILTQKPERTLREHLAKGRLFGKKIGKGWKLEMKSLEESGFLKITPPPAALRVNRAEPTLEPKPGKLDRSSPFNFGLFKELYGFYRELALFPKVPEKARLLTCQALENLCGGYLEFDRNRKSEFYRNVRTNLAHLWLSLELALLEYEQAPEESEKLKKLSQQVLTKMIPGISGTLRKIEKRTNGSQPS